VNEMIKAFVSRQKFK